MSQPFRFSWRPHMGYWSSAPLSGDVANYIFRGQNFIVRGGGDLTYIELWRGLNSIYQLAMTAPSGTMTKAAGNSTVTGTGTSFATQLVDGQTLIVQTTNGIQPIIVQQVQNDTSFLAGQLPPVFTNQGASYAREVQESDTLIVTYLHGSVIRLPRGHFIGVGLGTVTLNGVVPLSGGNTWTLAKKPSLLIANPSQDYTSIQFFNLGMATSVAPTLAAVAGGAKNMQPGRYSIRIVPARMVTNGFNNPSPTTEVVLTSAGQQIQVTFPVMDTANGQDSWRVYGTLYSTGEGVTGPWYYVATVTSSQLGGTGAGTTFNFEWRDAEIAAGDVLAFDNDLAPHATFITSLGGIPLLLGCNGIGRATGLTANASSGATIVVVTGGSPLGSLVVGQFIYINNQLFHIEQVTATAIVVFPPTPFSGAFPIFTADDAPGPVIRPAQPFIGGYNVEAYPARLAVALNPPETILGFVEGVGRIYLLTTNRLHIVTLSGNPSFPINVRPFWKSGFQNSRACIFVNGYLYGYTTNGPTRSAGDGDTVQEEHEFARPVQRDMAQWTPGLVVVGYDPKNEAVVYIYSNAGTNSGGFTYSLALMYMLRLGVWSTPIRLESTTSNFIVTSCATINGKLYVMANYVNISGVLNSVTYEWDAISSAGTPTISGYIATPFINTGAADFDHFIYGMNLTAYSNSAPIANIYGAGSNIDIPITSLEQALTSASGNITFTASVNNRISSRVKLNVRLLKVFATRVDISAPASDTQAGRIDEIVLDGNVTYHKY